MTSDIRILKIMQLFPKSDHHLHYHSPIRNYIGTEDMITTQNQPTAIGNNDGKQE